MAINVLEHSLGRIDGDVSDANTKVYGDVDAPFPLCCFSSWGGNRLVRTWEAQLKNK